MAKNAASEDALGELHATVATALSDAIKSGEASASVLAVAVTFLKNNNISADPSTNAELDELTRALAAKRKGGKDRLKEAAMAADDFASQLGMPGSLQ